VQFHRLEIAQPSRPYSLSVAEVGGSMQAFRRSVDGPAALPGLLARYGIGGRKMDYSEVIDSVDRLVDAQISAHNHMTSRLDTFETKLNRMALGGAIGGGATAGKKNYSPEMREWEAFLRKGPDAVERRNSLIISDDTAGGYLA